MSPKPNSYHIYDIQQGLSMKKYYIYYSKAKLHTFITNINTHIYYSNMFSMF